MTYEPDTCFSMDGAVNVLDYVMEDYMLLDYSDVNGSGRIVIE